MPVAMYLTKSKADQLYLRRDGYLPMTGIMTTRGLKRTQASDGIGFVAEPYLHVASVTNYVLYLASLTGFPSIECKNDFAPYSSGTKSCGTEDKWWGYIRSLNVIGGYGSLDVLNVGNYVDSVLYKAMGHEGVSGSFQDGERNIITVTKGIITNIGVK